MLKILLMFSALAFSALGGITPTTRQRITPSQEELEKKNLCYGYDVTSGKALYEPDSLIVANPIIDPNSGYLDYVTLDAKSSTKNNGYSAASLFSLNSKLGVEIGFGLSAGVGISKLGCSNTSLDTAFDLNVGLSNIKEEKYEVYYSKLVSHSYILQGLRTSEIKNYLSTNFKNDIAAVSSKEDAKTIFATYGTHLNTGYSYGGVMLVSEYTATNSTSVNLSESLSLKSKCELVNVAASTGVNTSFAEQFEMSLESSTTRTTFGQSIYGGENMASYSVSQLFTYMPSLFGTTDGGYYFEKWVRSINNDTKLAIVGVPYTARAQSIPVWNLLPSDESSSTIRGYFIEAFMEIAGDKYEEYLEKYKTTPRSLSLDEDDDPTASSVGDVYVRTKNNYIYSVNKNDLGEDDGHKYLYSGDILYLNLSHKINFENISINNGSTNNVEVLDLKRGIVRIADIEEGQSKRAYLTLRYGSGSSAVSKKLFDLEIKSNKFEGGAGTVKYPYLISKPEQFNYINSSAAANYLLVADLDFNGITTIPNVRFKGKLDGNYCIISNFRIKNNEEASGIFAFNEGSIQNLIIKSSGSALNNSEWQEGGIDLKTSPNDDANYSKHALNSRRVGVLCGENTDKGVIENVYIEDCFIRNFAKYLSADSVNSEQHLLCYTGGVCGVNQGNIRKTETKNVRILATLKNGNASARHKSFAGGIVGLNDGGTIENVVNDMDTGGYVLNKIFHTSSSEMAHPCEVSACGFVGFVSGSSNIEHSFVYANADRINVSIKSSYITRPSHVSKSSSFIAESQSAVSSSKLLVNIVNNSSNVLVDAYRPVGTPSDPVSINGNLEKINGIVESGAITDSNIRDEHGFDNIYSYTSNNNSHIKHLLSNNRSYYIDAVVDTNDRDCYLGEFYSVDEISISRYIGANPIESVGVFYVDSFEEKGGSIVNLFDFALSDLGANSFPIYLYGNGDQIGGSVININVKEPEIDRIYIANEVDDPIFTINFDDRKEFVENFSIDTLDVWAVLTSGQKVKLDSNSTYIKNAKLSITNTSALSAEDDLIEGDNVVTIQYGNSVKKTNSVSFILTCERHEVKDVLIDTMPSKTSYKTGETFDPRGMVVKVTYEDIDAVKYISGAGLYELEYTGDVISYGNNEVIITYENYNNRAVINVEGVGTEEVAYGLSLSSSSINLNKGSTFSLIATATNDGVAVSNPTLSYYSSNENVASVNPNGDITAVGVGEATITVKYNTASATCIVYVNEVEVPVEPSLIGLRVSGGTTKFNVNDTFTVGNLKVFAQYDDDSEIEIPYGSYTVTAPDLSQPGQSMVLISYNGFYATYTIKISSSSSTTPDNNEEVEKVLTSIEIFEPALKTTFKRKETFTYEGLSLLAHYSDGSVREVEPTRVSTPDMKVKGTQDVVVSYKENAVIKTTTYSIIVGKETKDTLFLNFLRKFWWVEVIFGVVFLLIGLAIAGAAL